jgi:hypothetical protein
VSALIDWAVDNAPIATDAGGDPIVGFTGGSYAGGIQTATTSIDSAHRRHRARDRLGGPALLAVRGRGDQAGLGRAAVLRRHGHRDRVGAVPRLPRLRRVRIPQEGGLHPLIHQGFAEGAATGTVSDDVLEFFAESSLAVYGQDNPVAIPTLVLQGSVDTLFDLTDGYRQFQHVRANGAPAKYVVFCGGHVACPEFYGDAGDRAHMNDLIIAWFDRYLKGDTSVDTGPTVEYRTNDGEWRTASDFPPADATWVEASGEGSLISIPGGDTPDMEELIDMLTGLQDAGGIPGLPITVAQPANDAELAAGQAFQFEVGVAAGPVELLGIPDVSLTVSGQGTEVILFVKLIHRERNHVINLQEGAIRVPLGDGEVTVDVTMPGIAYTLPMATTSTSRCRRSASCTATPARHRRWMSWRRSASPRGSLARHHPTTSPSPAPEPDTPDLPSTGAGAGAAGPAGRRSGRARRSRRARDLTGAERPPTRGPSCSTSDDHAVLWWAQPQPPRNCTMDIRKLASIGAIVLGVMLVIGGIGTWALVSSTLADQRITTPDDACLPEREVRGPFTAYCQAKIIEEHTLNITEGLTYAELDREDPRRQTAMNSSFLQASLFTSILAFGVAAMASAWACCSS